MSERNWFVEPIFEWREWVGGYNWSNFHFIHVMVERDKAMSGIEFWLIVLGVGFYWRWNDPKKWKASE